MKNVFPGICALSKGKYVYDLWLWAVLLQAKKQETGTSNTSWSCTGWIVEIVSTNHLNFITNDILYFYYNKWH
jgi:hypothetical protein